MKRLLKITGLILLIVVVLSGLFLLYSTFSDYTPSQIEIVYTSESPSQLNDSSEIRLMIWNIGYAGLCDKMDFFYDGGNEVMPEKKITEENLAGIRTYLESIKNSTDFFLLQEVDKKSKRSHRINQHDSIAVDFNEFVSCYGINYNVHFVPIPVTQPMGKVLSGLQTLSRYTPVKSVRHSFPGNYPWSMKIFMLDRCFLVNRYNISGGKQLLVINTHNSAYDDGTLRKNQLSYLKIFLLSEYEKGNYVIIGGDWNQCPPDFTDNFTDNIFDTIQKMDIPTDYLPSEWKWIYSNAVPTNRRVTKPYNPKETLTTVIDFFLASPNIEVVSNENIHLNFKYSDHNPVIMTVKLRNN